MRSTKRTTWATVMLLSMLAPLPVVAAPTVRFPDHEVWASPWETTTGSVTLAVTNATPVNLGGYTVVLDIRPRSGASGEVSFTGASHTPNELITSTTGPIFADTGDFVFITDVTNAGTVPLVNGNLFSLEYSMASGTAGQFDAVFLLSPLASELLDGVGDPIPTTFIGGTMDVTVIPEPGVMWLVGVGFGAGIWRSRGR